MENGSKAGKLKIIQVKEACVWFDRWRINGSLLFCILLIEAVASIFRFLKNNAKKKKKKRSILKFLQQFVIAIDFSVIWIKFSRDYGSLAESIFERKGRKGFSFAEDKFFKGYSTFLRNEVLRNFIARVEKICRPSTHGYIYRERYFHRRENRFFT